jgi:hypothetical protein
VLGDATDTGLLRYVDKLASSAVLRMAYKKVGGQGVPFSFSASCFGGWQRCCARLVCRQSGVCVYCYMYAHDVVDVWHVRRAPCMWFAVKEQ